jgi:2'-5' RNA ligase
MATAVSLWFDPAFENAVRSLWRELADATGASHLSDGPYRPHVTIGAWERAQVDELIAAIGVEAVAMPAPTLHFASARLFEGMEFVVYLAPDPGAEFTPLHQRVHALAAPFVATPLPYTTTPEWTPHCTVLWRVSERAVAERARELAERRLPLTGVGVALGVVDTPAEIELARLPIGLV